MTSNRPSWVVFIAALLLAGSAAVLFTPAEDTTPTPSTTPPACRALPDPDDCVQLVWLNGEWRCIPIEQAG